MTAQGTLQLVLYLGVLLLLVKRLGSYMASVYEGRPTLLAPNLRPVERGICLAGVNERAEAGWKQYALRCCS